MPLQPHHQMLRRVLFCLWIAILAATIYLFCFQRETVQRELHAAMSASLLAAGFIYLLLGGLRGFTLIPSTSLVLMGVAFFPPVPLFALTLVGILLSSTSIYFFSEQLHLEEILHRRHAGMIARLKLLLQRHGLPIIIGWSFFPVAPTDAICYVCGVLRYDFKKFLLGVGLGEGAICGVYIFCGDHFLRWLQLKL